MRQTIKDKQKKYNYMKKLDMMRAIKERGFMAKDIADKLGITTVAMSLRTNAKNPRLDTMIQIAEVIG